MEFLIRENKLTKFKEKITLTSKNIYSNVILIQPCIGLCINIYLYNYYVVVKFRPL